MNNVPDTDLLARVDTMEAGPEMDALVADLVMRWPRDVHPGYEGGFVWVDKGGRTGARRVLRSCWHPSADPVAALIVLEKLRDVWDEIVIRNHGRSRWHIANQGDEGIDLSTQYVQACGETLQVAACRAALKTVLAADVRSSTPRCETHGAVLNARGKCFWCENPSE